VTAVLADPSAADPNDAPTALAETGSSDVEPLLLGGLGLIAVGGIILITSRRGSRSRG
jgi:LPXTG-motif cell wall-anchored protein